VNDRVAEAVRWHDLECGSYVEDLALWREIAEEVPGPVLDVGAGTGRVSLDLAAHGHEVVALDVDGELLGELHARAKRRGLDVHTLLADARELAIGRTFGLVIVPMQTLQLLGGASGRARFYARVREHLRPGGVVAAALADALEGFDEEHTEPPLPDMQEVDGVVYASRPVAVRDVGDGVVIQRIRETVDTRGRRTASGNEIRLDRLTADEAAEELAAAGFTPVEHRWVPQTEEYVGSTVVVARA
jgi:SAM-dependent methyltransferase